MSKLYYTPSPFIQDGLSGKHTRLGKKTAAGRKFYEQAIDGFGCLTHYLGYSMRLTNALYPPFSRR